jgi:hypothetical protein
MLTRSRTVRLSLLLSGFSLAMAPRAATDTKPKELVKATQQAVDRTSDPYDGRHVELTVFVSPEKLVIEDAVVQVGVAPGSLAGSSALRVRVMDGRRDLILETGFPDPLSLRVYNLGPAPNGEPNPKPRGYSPVDPDAPPHTTEEQKEARLTILVPLMPTLGAVSVGWSDGARSETFDLLDTIERGCAKDEHRACRAWVESASRLKP